MTTSDNRSAAHAHGRANPLDADAATRALTPLPAGWRRLFFVELPLVAVTLALWLLAPATYLHDTVGIAAPGAPEILLLRLYAGTVASLVFGFYAWLLWQPTVHRPTFRAFQACLGAGDVAVVAASLAHWPHATNHTLLAAQIGMATLWGAVRGGYLLRA